MGGDIEVESEPDRGSVFTVTIARVASKRHGSGDEPQWTVVAEARRAIARSC